MAIFYRGPFSVTSSILAGILGIQPWGLLRITTLYNLYGWQQRVETFLLKSGSGRSPLFVSLTPALLLWLQLLIIKRVINARNYLLCCMIRYIVQLLWNTAITRVFTVKGLFIRSAPTVRTYILYVHTYFCMYSELWCCVHIFTAITA